MTAGFYWTLNLTREPYLFTESNTYRVSYKTENCGFREVFWTPEIPVLWENIMGFNMFTNTWLHRIFDTHCIFRLRFWRPRPTTRLASRVISPEAGPGDSKHLLSCSLKYAIKSGNPGAPLSRRRHSSDFTSKSLVFKFDFAHEWSLGWASWFGHTTLIPERLKRNWSDTWRQRNLFWICDQCSQSTVMSWKTQAAVSASKAVQTRQGWAGLTDRFVPEYESHFSDRDAVCAQVIGATWPND